MKIYVAGVLAAVALGAVLPASARSITGASFTQSGATTTVDVTFEAGEAGDDHALYVAYDVEDRGAALADWAAYQRVGRVAADATSATFTLLPSLTGRGYGICRVFLTTSTLPYDTLLEAIRQTGTQWFDTGVTPGPTTFVQLDCQLDTIGKRQQRPFGVSSDDDSALFSFDSYVSNGGTWSSACQDGKGNWLWAGAASTDRVRISLDAASGMFFVTNLITGTTTTSSHANATRTATSAGTLSVFAHRYYAEGAVDIRNIVAGGLIHSVVISNENACVGEYLPCMCVGRAGLYNAVDGTFAWSASAEDFVAGGDPAPCAPAPGEALVAASDAFDLFNPASGALWKGTASGNWNGTDANWTVNGTAGQAWTDGNDAIFNDSAVTRAVTIPAAVTPSSVTFFNSLDYTLAGEGGIAGTGSFAKYGEGKLMLVGVNNSFTGDMLLAGGEIVLPSSKDSRDITSGSLGNPRAERVVAVSNATLRLLGNNSFGGSGRSTTPIRASLKFWNSTLELTTNFCCNLGDVYLHNSTVNFHGGLTYLSSTGSVGAPNSNSFWGSFSVANLYFSGNRQVVFEVAETNGVNEYSAISISKFARQGTIDVPDMTGDDSSDVIFRVPIVWTSGTASDPGIASGFRKTGAGTLELASAFSTNTGDVDVVEGTLKLSANRAKVEVDRTSCFGAQRYPRTVTVHPGATLWLGNSDLMGQFYASNNVTVHVNGGTLKQTEKKTNGLGPLILENASLSYSGVTGAWPTFGFSGGLSVIGTNALTFANTGSATVFFGTGAGTPSDCYVAEISGNGAADDTTDLKFSTRLADAPKWSSYKVHPVNMRKTGPGTLELANNTSLTTGRIEVAEGTLKCAKMSSSNPNFECPTNTALGDLRDPKRVALVLNGGTLWLTASDTFGQANTVNSSIFAVTNGTIRQSTGVVNALPALDLYDATFVYSGSASGGSSDLAEAQPWGTFIFAQRVRFDGTRPYDLQNVGATCHFSLGWQSDTYQVPSTKTSGYTDQHGKTEFYVADITHDANPDVTIGVVLKFPCRWNGNDTNSKYAKTYFRTGLLKTGPGTLRLNCGTAAGKYYAEATRVNGGTLLVDAATFNSTNVFVQAGAYLGGTGTVARATIEAGGGFAAAPGQTRPLTLTAATLPANGEVALDVPYTGDIDNLTGVSVPVVTANALAGAKWRVTFNGAEVPKGYVGMASVRDGIVYASVARGGTILIIR